MKNHFISLCLTLLHIHLKLSAGEQCAQLHSYGEYGCYDSGKYFSLLHRPISVAPNKSSEVNTKFGLYTKNNKPDMEKPNPIYLKINEKDSFKNFNAKNPVKFIVHGFIENGSLPWVLKMANELLEADDVNVIAIDWSGGNSFPYHQAVANTWIVGGDIWLLSKFMMEEFQVQYENIHIIGHSLGAQIAANAGLRMQGKLGRISALDPAGPDFEHMPTNARLDESDAMYVDVIHTDAGIGGFGIQNPVGHQDFFINEDDTGLSCKFNSLVSVFTSVDEAIAKFAACKHQKSVHMYIESIGSSCPFLAHKCSDFTSYKQGQCTGCELDGHNCAKMGYHAKDTKARGKFYLSTPQDPPYCVYHHSVSVKLTENPGSSGILTLTLIATKSISLSLDISRKYLWDSNYTYVKMTETREEIGVVNQVSLLWSKSGNLLQLFNSDEIKVSKITIEPMDITPEEDRRKAIAVFCQKDNSPVTVKSGQSIAFDKKCTE